MRYQPLKTQKRGGRQPAFYETQNDNFWKKFNRHNTDENQNDVVVLKCFLIDNIIFENVLQPIFFILLQKMIEPNCSIGNVQIRKKQKTSYGDKGMQNDGL